MIHFTPQLSIFDQSVLLILNYEDALIDHKYVQDPAQLEAEKALMLCAVSKKMLYQLIKTNKSHYDGYDTSWKLKSMLDQLETDGDLVKLQLFLIEYMDRIEELIPNREHRNYRSSRFKVDFLQAVSAYPTASGEAADKKMGGVL